MSKKSHYKSPAAKQPVKKVEQEQEKKARKPLILPVVLLFFLLVWAWCALYYGDVMRIAREYSFWVADTKQMKYILDQNWNKL